MMKDIFGKSTFIKNVGEIYPVKVKDYDVFSENSGLLYISKNHFDERFQQYPLLDLIIASYSSLNLSGEDFLNQFCQLFELVTCKKVSVGESNKQLMFKVGENNFINSENYEDIRKEIMRQNLMHEQKVYKTELMRKWAEKAMKAKQKTAPKISLEDIITTISVGCSKTYSELENYTIYQIYSDFYRLRKMVEYDSNVQFRCAGADLKLEDYAEDLDLYHNPYDDLFVSADKLGGLNKMVK